MGQMMRHGMSSVLMGHTMLGVLLVILAVAIAGITALSGKPCGIVLEALGLVAVAG